MANYIISVVVWVAVALLVIFGGGYLSACAGAGRWLTFREWWGY